MRKYKATKNGKEFVGTQAAIEKKFGLLDSQFRQAIHNTKVGAVLGYRDDALQIVQLAEKKETNTERQAEDENAIVFYAKSGYKISYIAARLRVSKTRVEDVLKKHASEIKQARLKNQKSQIKRKPLALPGYKVTMRINQFGAYVFNYQKVTL